ncbi:acetyl-CoA carboxylase biotin carboxyl carrier protein [Ruminococcus flavefaciens]|uniref:acetyl-CoA carboxylase biotin carboxyl carrier protein n=1 Tax=Ruminococcus flavefaciens TaxID=1265 RepID=UPI000490AF1D|nr:acetyl-CoA carboxylase biotin carboxyl carrier protein [Ruminococcus flavefaciens]
MEKIYGQFDLETIEKLADIINKKELSELTISSGDNTITIKGKKSVPAMSVPMMAAAPAQPASIDSTLAASEASMAEEVSGKIVKSPIVGTFYSAPSPDKPPFVKTGDEVKKGDVIMIIESMKLMNEIQSEYDGVVEQILVSDGQAVEFDQPIMVIK